MEIHTRESGLMARLTVVGYLTKAIENILVFGKKMKCKDLDRRSGTENRHT
jgi:hypothetical protein